MSCWWPWPASKKKPDPDLADISGSTIVEVVWECPTKDQCNREKAELVQHRERVAAHALKLAEENERLRTDLGLGLKDPLP